ncbi:MAG: heparin lyase I family protein [Candidatus Thorarchaeota archaeon]|jgi:hypothetical protein
MSFADEARELENSIQWLRNQNAYYEELIEELVERIESLENPVISEPELDEYPNILFKEDFSNWGAWFRVVHPREERVPTGMSYVEKRFTNCECRCVYPAFRAETAPLNLNGSYRAQRQPFHTDLRFVWSQRIDFTESDKHKTIMAQIHGSPDDLEDWRSPIFAIMDNQGHLLIRKRFTKNEMGSGPFVDLYDKPWPVPFGEWLHWELRTKLTWHDDGYILLYLNGEQIIGDEGPNAYNDEKGPFFKYGIYRPTNKSIVPGVNVHTVTLGGLEITSK